MALSATATQVEFRAAYEATQKLEVALRQYYDGSATPTKPNRFSEVEVQAWVDAVQAALAALEA